ncbi:MAG: HD domain-containing protein [Candidatus Omnitrophota bacterium]
MKESLFSKKIPYFSLIAALARKQHNHVWLVGGFLRDIYLKRTKELCDFDFCVEKKARFFASAFAKKIHSKYIVLDERQGSFRVILKRNKKIYTYDFTRMRGKDIREDLSLRDFSINTLALPLDASQAPLIDYFQGRKDMRKKIIRTVQERVIVEDPLRILRGFSFMVNYGCRLEKNTQKAMVKHKHLLRNVSRERINEELFKIFASSSSYPAIKRMDEFKIIDEIIPQVSRCRGVLQGGYHHLDVWQHSLEALREFELLYRRRLVKHKELREYLQEELAQGRRRFQIIKLACLLHDIGKPLAKRKKGKRTIFHMHEKIGRDLMEHVAKGLRLSLREKDLLKKLTFWHLRPGYLADQVTPSQRAIYHFFRDTEEEGAAVIVLSLSDWRATRGPLTNAYKRKRHEKVMFGLMNGYFTNKKKKPLPRLVDGYDVMRKFNITPSPLVGKILKKIKEEQVLGKVKNKNQAYLVAKDLVKKAKVSG